MREILFKAKRIDNGEWVEGLLWKKKYNASKMFISCFPDKDDNEEAYVVDSKTICQYTGLTDKNGKKIWENDVLFADDIASFVRWDDEEARFVMDDYGTQGCLMEYGFDEDAGEYGVVDTYGFDDFTTSVSEIFEVIGNIFDNPELLKVGEA